MAQTQNEHLTAVQLSASLDKQLSPQEQASFDAHIASCQQCQNNLADLRLTATLLHSLPVEEVPRSFILPAGVSIAPDRATRQGATISPLPSRQRTQNTALRRSARFISALAAVLALCFIISGMLPLIYHGGGSSTASSSTGTYNPATKVNPTITAQGAEQPNKVAQPSEATANAKATDTARTHTPASTATPIPNNEHASNANPGTVTQPAIDLGQPGVRLGIGIIVLALSIIILIITRQRRVSTH